MTDTQAKSPNPSSTPANVVKSIVTAPLNWLILALPVAVVLHHQHAGELWVFLASAVTIIPLAGLMGRATENLSETMGAGIGGLMNATFGNAAELIIALVALKAGPEMYPLIKASLTGSIIGNILLVLGLALAAGGVRYPKLKFNGTAASMGSTLLALAGVGLLVPTMYFYVFKAGSTVSERELLTLESLSEEISAVLIITYILSLVFSLQTHSHLFAGPEEDLPTTGENHQPEWNRATSVIVLLVATMGVAWMSEMLVDSVTVASKTLGLSGVFVGVIVVAIIGNAAEHSTAVLMALKNKIDLSVNIAVGSSIQIALFVSPVLVFASMFMNEQPLDLHFTLMEALAVIISIAALTLVCHDGESHWLEGVMLLAVYVILGLAFYHLPDVESFGQGVGAK